MDFAIWSVDHSSVVLFPVPRFRSFPISISMMSRLSSIIPAPTYALGSSRSPAKKNATMLAKTGSSVKMIPTCVALVYCWAMAWQMKAMPVQNTARKMTEIQQPVLCGSTGCPNRIDSGTIQTPVNPS